MLPMASSDVISRDPHPLEQNRGQEQQNHDHKDCYGGRWKSLGSPGGRANATMAKRSEIPQDTTMLSEAENKSSITATLVLLWRAAVQVVREHGPRGRLKATNAACGEQQRDLLEYRLLTRNRG